MEKRAMDSKEIVEKIKKSKKDIRKCKVKKLGLFGSYLKGNQKKNSDVDILVEFEERTLNNYFALMNLLEKVLLRKIDLVLESELKPELEYVRDEAKYVKI